MSVIYYIIKKTENICSPTYFLLVYHICEFCYCKFQVTNSSCQINTTFVFRNRFKHIPKQVTKSSLNTKNTNVSTKIKLNVKMSSNKQWKKYQECYDISAAIAIWLNAVAALRTRKRWGYVCSVKSVVLENGFNTPLPDLRNKSQHRKYTGSSALIFYTKKIASLLISYPSWRQRCQTLSTARFLLTDLENRKWVDWNTFFKSMCRS